MPCPAFICLLFTSKYDDQRICGTLTLNPARVKAKQLSPYLIVMGRNSNNMWGNELFGGCLHSQVLF